LTKRSAAEAFGAEQLATKLCEHLEAVQRSIAERCDPMCPFNAESNLLGQMTALLKERRYAEIHVLLQEWDRWAGECGVIIREVQKAGLLIEGFCDFYEASNGFARQRPGVENK